mmetsp:Transcript_49778/g.41983  ORF Transcript_49778/g.41983 Transcript_49778/m.41983 type:complete len:130 (+) Transcript_49778:152-541(+)
MEVGTLEAIRVKIMIQGSNDDPTAIKIELMSENDLYFHYVFTCDELAFKRIQEGQKLMVGLSEFPQLLFKMLNSCIIEPHQFLSVFIMSRDGLARLDFIQNMEYKFVELLTLEYMASSEEQVRQQITYR